MVHVRYYRYLLYVAVLWIGIRIGFSADPDPALQVKENSKKKNFTAEKNPVYLIKNCNFLALHEGLIIFALLDPDLADQNQCGYMRIRMQNTCLLVW